MPVLPKPSASEQGHGKLVRGILEEKSKTDTAGAGAKDAGNNNGGGGAEQAHAAGHHPPPRPQGIGWSQ